MIWIRQPDRDGWSNALRYPADSNSAFASRAIALQPEVILFDEPTSALDPISTAKIEELIDELAGSFTIIIVTHILAGDPYPCGSGRLALFSMFEIGV